MPSARRRVSYWLAKRCFNLTLSPGRVFGPSKSATDHVLELHVGLMCEPDTNPLALDDS